MADQQQSKTYQPPAEIVQRIKHKLVLLGNQYVGKTSIIEQYVYGSFDDKIQVFLDYQPTVGVDFIAKNMKLDDKNIRLLLWDTAGQERFQSLIPSYLRDASGAIIVYDVTSNQAVTNKLIDRKSFEGVEGWYNQVRNARGNEALIVLMGNKIDLPERQILYDEAVAYAKEKDMIYFEVSAKLGTKVEESLSQICLALPNDTSFLITQSQCTQQKAIIIFSCESIAV